MVNIDFSIDEFITNDDYTEKIKILKTHLIETQRVIVNLQSRWTELIPNTISRLANVMPTEAMNGITRKWGAEIDEIGDRARRVKDGITQLEEKEELAQPQVTKEDIEEINQMAKQFNDLFEEMAEVKAKNPESEEDDIDQIYEEIYM